MARIQTKLNKETSKPEAGEGTEYMRRVERRRDNDIQVLNHFKVVMISKISIQPWLLRLYLLGYRHPFLPFSEANTGSNIILAAVLPKQTLLHQKGKKKFHLCTVRYKDISLEKKNTCSYSVMGIYIHLTFLHGR